MTNPVTGKPLGGIAKEAIDAAEKVAGGGGAKTGGLSAFFGDSGIGTQLFMYSVISSIVNALLSPAITDITTGANAVDPVAVLPPAELASLVKRKFMTAGDATAEAAKSGIGPGRFAQLVQLAGSPPSLSLLFAAYQRGLIGDGAAESGGLTLQAAMAQLGIEDQWADTVKALTVNIPTSEAVMEALLEGQITRDEALTRYLAAGGDPTWFDTDYNRQGQAPTPTQALEMLNRGFIPRDGEGPTSISYHQAFLEGPWRDKWEDVFAQLRFYLSPPRTVTAMLREGSITQARALQLFQDNGLDEQTTAEYLAAAGEHTTAKQRELSMTQTVELYESHLIDAADAVAHLVALGYTTANANLLLSLADTRTATASIKQATTRLRTLYLNGSNTATQTTAALHTLGVSDANITNLLAAWNLERVTTTRTLSESQIVAAFFYDVITQPEAMTRLAALGYSAHDAWILLSTRDHAPLPDEPAV